jgi:hypothetical protein
MASIVLGRKSILAWRSIDEENFSNTPPLTFLSYIANPPLTDVELREYLTDEHNEHIQRWVVLEPLDRNVYSLETRSRDLVKRMLAAKIGNADGIFIPRPFDAAHGLMEPDGTPGPLLLPWRTAAEMLAGTRYLGKIVLPNRSSNYVFERDGEAMMVVWNSVPVEERLYLGDDVYQIDLWGNKTAAEFETDRNDFKKQSIQVGALPIFLTGVDATIAQWRMSLEIETKKLESIFGQRQRVFITSRINIRVSVVPSLRLFRPPGSLTRLSHSSSSLQMNCDNKTCKYC